MKKRLEAARGLDVHYNPLTTHLGYIVRVKK
jgi:hypothetical protein